MASAFKKAILFSAGLVSLSSGVAQAAGGGESSGGLPQLDLTTWPTQLFWLVVTFTLAYILISRLVTPKIGAVFEERAGRISGDLDKAKEADEQARATREAYEAELAEARSNGAAKAKAAMDAATAEAAKQEAELDKKLARKVKTAETKLAKLREDAMASLDDVAAEAAMQTVEQLTGMKATKAAVAKQIKSASAQLNGA